MKPVERLKLINSIAQHLQTEYTMRDIRLLLEQYYLPVDVTVIRGKKVYAEEVLREATKDQLNRIASELGVSSAQINVPVLSMVVDNRRQVKESPKSTLDIFISHSSADALIAKSLISLLRAALDIPADRIRCTSIDGYRLGGGAFTEDELRREVLCARVFIGLITKQGLRSAYVMFELGARWGAKKFLIPLLAGGAHAESLSGPLTGINALDCREAGQVSQIIEDIAKELGIRCNSRAVFLETEAELLRAANAPEHIEKDKAGEHTERKTTPSGYDEADCRILLFEYLENTLRREGPGKFLVRYEQVDKEIGLPQGATYSLIEEVAQNFGMSCTAKGASVMTLEMPDYTDL